MTDKRQTPEGRLRPQEGRLERRLWIAGYVVIFLLVAAGALRQLLKLFG